MFVLSLPVLSVVLGVACSSPPEQQLLKRYFDATRMRDNTTLANIATVSWPPEQGVVASFEIVSIGAEERRPIRVKDLAAAEAAARQADEDFNKKKQEYQDANRTAIERVLKAERARANLRGADAETQKAWTKWRDDTATHSRALAEARQALSAERMAAEPSVYDARSPIDLTQFDGELVTKDVAIRAQVRGADGATQPKELHVTLTRAELKNGPEGKAVNGRWIITQINEAGAASSSN